MNVGGKERRFCQAQNIHTAQFLRGGLDASFFGERKKASTKKSSIEKIFFISFVLKYQNR
jgi:hypothetical protein